MNSSLNDNNSFSNDTNRFLSAFPSNLPFIFQAKDDGRGTKDIATVKKYGKIWHKTGNFDESIVKWLKNHNNDAWGCFFAVNELDQALDPAHKRTINMITRIRSVWVEDDNKRDTPRNDWPIEPSFIVNSSPGKFHYYWLTDIKPTEMNKIQWEGVMSTLVTKYDCDNNAKDLARVLRLPGFYHMKDPENPHLVVFMGNGTVYDWVDIISAFPPADSIEGWETDTREKAINESETLTKTMAELIADYQAGHRHGPSSRTAMKLANYNVPLDEIIAILCAIFTESSYDHHAQSAASAIKKINSERYYKFHSTGSGTDKKELPHFNTSFVRDWPQPWPLIFKTFEDAIYQVIEEIYVPACFAYHSVLLGSIFRTVRGRGCNLNMQIISASGVGKDSNTSEPIERILTHMKGELKDSESESDTLGLRLLSPIYESVTADTTYLKTLGFEENKDGGLILNTEASGHWDMVANADNPHTEGVMRIEINAWDGHNISGKVVGKSRFEDMHNPNYTMLRLQQTEAIERNLTQRMIDIGLGNRIDYYADNIDRPEVASTELSSKEIKINSEYVDFLRFVFKFIHAHKGYQIKVSTSKSGGFIHRFETETLLPLVNNDNISRDEYKFIKRIIGSAEKQTTEIAAFCYMWRIYNGESVDDIVLSKLNDIVLEIDGGKFEQFILPFMEYQLKIRRFLYNNILNTSQATAETIAINEVWERCVKKVSHDYEPWHAVGGIVATHFNARVKAHKFFSKNPKYNNPETINRAINNWVLINGLELKKIDVDGKKRACYVMN
jgi:hypothetical protein